MKEIIDLINRRLALQSELREVNFLLNEKARDVDPQEYVDYLTTENILQALQRKQTVRR